MLQKFFLAGLALALTIGCASQQPKVEIAPQTVEVVVVPVLPSQPSLDSLFHRAEAFLNLKEYQEAAEIFQVLIDTLEQTSRDQHLDSLLCLSFLNSATCYGNLGDSAKVFQNLEMAVSIFPTPHLLCKLGGYYLEFEKPELARRAIPKFERVLAVAPKDIFYSFTAYKGLAGAYYDLDDYRQVLKNAEMADVLRPGDVDVVFFIAAALMELDRDKEALAAFERANKLAPKDHPLKGLIQISVSILRITTH